MSPVDWVPAQPLRTPRLTLEPLRIEHAREAAAILDDARLHEFTGGRPATPAQLLDRYRRLVVGRSPDRRSSWCNWMLRDRATAALIGTVQATLHLDGAPSAEIAWVVASGRQGCGYAKEGASAMADWLRGQGTDVLVAHVHPRHEASMAVARHVGLRPTEVTVDGETRWRWAKAG